MNRRNLTTRRNTAIAPSENNFNEKNPKYKIIDKSLGPLPNLLPYARSGIDLFYFTAELEEISFASVTRDDYTHAYLPEARIVNETKKRKDFYLLLSLHISLDLLTRNNRLMQALQLQALRVGNLQLELILPPLLLTTNDTAEDTNIAREASLEQPHCIWGGDKFLYREMERFKLDCGYEVRHLSRLVAERGETRIRYSESM
ncbi:hypothetical protein EVAR_32845_1 [Eumeta japonica]|uniref:Uncharacterized protein n=1 Tax=Eumeta variegata TaxID=151549 RepID=A0A4C1WBL6_EUMVA|nr:hypothetical protein EVAR_32845_1 [Eumeta japonica]